MSLLAVGIVGLALAQAHTERPNETAFKAKVARSLPLARSMASEPAVVQDKRAP